MKMLISLALVVAVPIALALPAPLRAQAAQNPEAALDDLLAADRAFSAASAKTDLVSGLSAMFDKNIVMPAGPKGFAQGMTQVVATLMANPANAEARVKWAPIRGGISADGQHGFSYGYVTMRRAGQPDAPGKYLSYWVKRPEGWRVAAYKRVPRKPGEVETAMRAPSLPPGGAAASSATARASLIATEKAFSDEAQRIGLSAAFRKYGRPDAMNIFGEVGFDIGLDSIAALFPADEKTAKVHWAADGALVASSGDFGVTWGFIRPNAAPAPGEPAAIPFFTIWRRDGAKEPWRYVAE